MSVSQINSSMYTLLGSVVFLLLSTFGGYVYSSSNAISTLQLNIKYLSKQVDRILNVIEKQQGKQGEVEVIARRIDILEKSTSDFINYGNRFSRQDWEVEKVKIIKIINSKCNKKAP